MAIFPTFFLGNIGQENLFHDILERKNAFLGHKNRKSKNSQSWHFSQGVTHGFGPKMAIFPNFFFLGNIGQENVFYDILERKKAFLGYKKKKSKKSQIHIFPGGLTHAFGPKMAIFPTLFFLVNIGPRKCLLWYSRQKKRLSRLQKQEVQKVEKLTFFPRG